VEESRPLRRDAKDNLTRILAAARDVFAEQGYDACMEDIALRADVGVGTLYRRFPHKADLFDAVVESASAQTRAIAEEVLSEELPGEAVFEFVRRCIAVPSCWRATISAPPRTHGASAALETMSPLLEAILDQSRSAGTIRDDVEVADIVITLMAVRSIADLCDGLVPGTSVRFLELALDGLRPGNASPGHKPLTLEQISKVLRQR